MRAARAFAVLLVLAVGVPAAWVLWLPDVRPLKTKPPETTAYIELRRRQAKKAGKPFVLRRTWVPYSQISEHLKKAVVTAEDDVYWRHDGVDWDALKAAWDRDMRSGTMAAGGSTITMQLARNLYLSPSKNPLRKLKEILIARRLEKTLGKVRVLELYLNSVEWGKGIFGCEAAAQEYFGKPCADLSPDEAVAMAVVLPNPRRWDPAKGGKYVERNSERIRGRMRASGWYDDFSETSDDLTSLPPEASTAAQRGATSENDAAGAFEMDQGRKPVVEE